MPKDHKNQATHANHILALKAHVEKQKIEKKKRMSEYYSNPKLCQNIICDHVIPYDKKSSNKYCSSSCAAKMSNMQRPAGHESRSKGNESRKIKARLNAVSKKIEYCKVSFCKECGAVIRNSNIKTCSVSCRNKILSRTASNNPMMGGNKNNKAHGWYNSPHAGKVWLESSYELKVAQELDSNNISWCRPSYLPYNNGKKYFADFYLVKYDIYLDPKNDYLILKDAEKIEAVEKENSVRVLVLDKNNLVWSKIKNLLG